MESLRLFVDGSDVTSADVTIQDQNGNSVENTSGFLEDNRYLTISWDAGKELSVAAGQTRTLTLRGTPQGFNLINTFNNPRDSFSWALYPDVVVYTNQHIKSNSDVPTIWGLYHPQY